MSRLDDYRTALLAAHPEVETERLEAALNAKGDRFARFIIDHGLGPLWHDRTGDESFRASRMQAEALYVSQEKALREAGSALDAAAIGHVVIKGAATRLLVYENPALRACFDLDFIVLPGEKVAAADSLADLGYCALPEERSISRELVLSRRDADIDLHWALLREGRLRTDLTESMLAQRRHVDGVWMLRAEHALYLLLVHPAFAKHLDAYEMGLHRVADLLAWLRCQKFDWPEVRAMLDASGVRTAAWATLRWTGMLAGEYAPTAIAEMLPELEPGKLRRRWLESWLSHDLPARTARLRWLRLVGFTSFLHDTVGDAWRAARGRRRAVRRIESDLAEFEGLGRE